MATIEAVESMAEPTFTVSRARYAKGMLLVRTVSDGSGYKTRTDRLIGDGLRARWTHRERGYVCSAAKVLKLKRLVDDGSDCSWSGKIEPPREL